MDNDTHPSGRFNRCSRNVGLGVMRSGDSIADPYSNMDVLIGMVRNSIRNAGLSDREEHPFEHIVHPGDVVLIKPNWVNHVNKSGLGMDCTITHPALIKAVLADLRRANPSRIIIGDAPIQSAIFERIIPGHIIEDMARMVAPIPIELEDFRYQICTPGVFSLRTTVNPERASQGILFDLAADSLLEPVSDRSSLFRNTSYDHRVLKEYHAPGRHQYRIVGEVFESDVIINMPKLKTHRKAGLTGALKNLVGVNSNKDYLPHHRAGGTIHGGDCYPGSDRVKQLAESMMDMANRHIGGRVYALWQVAAILTMKMVRLFSHDTIMDGSWYGNDTTWRMVLDLNRIVRYGKKDGSIDPHPQRDIVNITDGIVAGEGYGPLAPEPVPLGIVTCSMSSPAADLVHAALMGFDWRKIPVVAHAFDSFAYRLADQTPDDVMAVVDGSAVSHQKLSEEYGKQFKPVESWKNRIEKGSGTTRGM